LESGKEDTADLTVGEMGSRMKNFESRKENKVQK
jgi:hypothetical protein